MLQPAYTVVLAVGVEVGMEATYCRNVHALGSSNRRPSEWTFRRNVYNCRTMMTPGLLQEPSCRHSKLQSVIAGKRQPANADVIDFTIQRAISLSWMDHGDLIAACAQSAYQTRQGNGDAIYFGRVGLGNNADMLLIEAAMSLRFEFARDRVTFLDV